LKKDTWPRPCSTGCYNDFMLKNKYFKIALVIILILALSQAVYLLPELSSPKPVADQKNIQEATNQQRDFNTEGLYLLINAHRKENNLSPLLIDPRLEESAAAKINDMISQKYYRHEDTVNQESWYLFNSAGYDYKMAGENISLSHNTPWQVFQAWSESETHNEQMLKPNYEEMGLAADCHSFREYGGENCVIVLHLGLR